MHPLVDKWLLALESGDYKQGTGYLRTKNNEFCCLGVLCDLAAKEGILKEPVILKHDGFYCYEDKESKETKNYNMLPSRLADILGMSIAGSYYPKYVPNHYSLWQDNDSRKKSFKEIADIIRDNADTMFNYEKPDEN